MAKKSYKKNIQNEIVDNEETEIVSTQSISVFEKYKIHFLLFLFASLLYANTLQNQYASDDTLVYTSNQFTQKGIAGLKEIFTNDAFVGFFGERGKTLVAGGRYRPLSIATFALEVQFFGKNNPTISHAINAILYGLCVVMIYILLLELFHKNNDEKTNWWLSIPFLIALLYASHPIHTEAVANIKGRDEIMGMLFSMCAVFFSIKYIKTLEFKNLIIFSILLFLAYLSKENAITMIGVVFITYFVFYNAKSKNYFNISIAYIIPTILFLLLRNMFTTSKLSKFTKELLNDPFVTSSVTQKFGTLFYTFITYLKLQIVPYPLTHDYYPYQIPKVSFDNIVVILSVLINVGLFIYAVYSIYKHKSKIGYGLMFYFITFSVVSQVFFTIGTAMNERFVFMPSLGIIIAFVLVLYHFASKYNINLLYAVFAIVAIYSFITIQRNPVWKNDESLFLNDIHISTNSAKLNLAAGGVLIDSAITKTDTLERKKMLQQAIIYLKKATEIYGDTTLIIDNEEIHIGHSNAYNLLGNAYYFLNGDLKNAEKAYKMADYYNPGHFDSYQNLVTIFYNEGKYAEAIPLLKALIGTDPNNAGFLYKLGDAYKNTANYDSAIVFYMRAIDKNDKNYNTLATYQVGLTYARYKNDLNNGIIYLSKACDLDPNNLTYNEDLGVAYAVSGRPAEAITYLKKCIQIQPNYQNAIKNIVLAYQARGMADSSKYYQSLITK